MGPFDHFRNDGGSLKLAGVDYLDIQNSIDQRGLGRHVPSPGEELRVRHDHCKGLRFIYATLCCHSHIRHWKPGQADTEREGIPEHAEPAHDLGCCFGGGGPGSDLGDVDEIPPTPGALEGHHVDRVRLSGGKVFGRRPQLLREPTRAT